MRARHKLSYNNKSYSGVAALLDCFLLSALAVCLSSLLLTLSVSILWSVSLCRNSLKPVFFSLSESLFGFITMFITLLSELIDFSCTLYHLVVCSGLCVLCPSLPSVIPLGHSMCSDTRICRSTPFSPDFSILAWPPQSDQYINLRKMHWAVRHGWVQIQ